MTAPDARWTEEAVRLYRRYELEFVEAHDLCPFAMRVRRDGALAERVLLQSDDEDVEPSLVALDALGAHVQLALLLYPRLPLGRDAFERFAARVREADSSRRARSDASFVFVAFHPEAQPNLEEPERLIPFLRRSPDPTIQVVRSGVLDRVRGAVPEGTQFVDVHALDTWQPQPPSLRERIAQANMTTTLRIGIETLARQLDEIMQDRERTYRALAAETPAEDTRG